MNALRSLSGVTIIIAALFILGWMSFFTIRDGYVGVKTTFGEFAAEPSMPGINAKIPFIQGVIKMDTKIQTVTYKGPQDLEDGDGLINKPAITVLDNKNLPIGVEMTIQYRPKAEEMPGILRNYGKNYFDKAINPVIRDVVRDIAGSYEAETVAQKRAEIGAAITMELQNKFSELPFILGEVALRNLALPPSVLNKIQQVQEAKQEEQRLSMVEKQAEVNKRIEIINAEREAEKRIIEAKAKAEAILAVANAQSAANRKLAASLTQLLVKQQAVDKWDGKYPTTLMSDDTGVLLNMQTK